MINNCNLSSKRRQYFMFSLFFTDDRNPRPKISSKFLFVFEFSLLKNSLSSKIFSRRFAKLCATWTRACTVVRHSTTLVCGEALRENVPCVRQVFALIIVWLLVYFYIFFPQITVAWWVFFLVDDSAVEKTRFNSDWLQLKFLLPTVEKQMWGPA